MIRNVAMTATLRMTWLALTLAIGACSEKGVQPQPPTLEGDWIITNGSSGVETRLELEQRDNNLTGFWHQTQLSIRVTGRITPSNELSLTGQASNRTYVFNAEANDGLSRFSGTLSVFDVRGDRVSLHMISGRR